MNFVIPTPLSSSALYEQRRGVGVFSLIAETTTVYDDAGRVISSVERNRGGTLITGFEYTYDLLGRALTERRLDKNLEIYLNSS